ncbi:MAG: cyclic-di-AMP receptor [Oscillospiraceae bacterium]
MKMVTAIINKDDSHTVCKELTEKGFFFTKLSTQGGFLSAGNVTLLCGVDDEKVDEIIKIISDKSRQRTEVVPSSASYGIGVATAYPLEVTVGGATVFVTNVERFEKL